MPVCPTHGTELKVSKLPQGGFYCSQRTESGEYCKFKIAGPPPTSIPKPAASPISASGDALAAASLHFAAELFKGGGPEMLDEAIAAAIKAYQAMKAVG